MSISNTCTKSLLSKRLMLLPLAILFMVMAFRAGATGQSGELIIYQGDTLQMLSEPLESYLSSHEPRENFYPFLENGCSTALWRGYIGLWTLQDGKLYLVDVYGCGKNTISIKDKIFPGATGPVYAEWFSGHLAIQKGKMILYHHSGYDRYYEKEILISVQQGLVVGTIEYENGVRPGDQRFSHKPEDIQSEIYKRINWHKLPALSNKKRLYVDLKIGNDGSFYKAEILGELGDPYQSELENVLKNFPLVQVFYSRGTPLQEGWIIPILFSAEMKRKGIRKIKQ